MPAAQLHDLTTLRQFMTGPGLFAFFDAPWLPFYLVVIFLFDWILGVFAVVGTLVLVVVLAVVNEAVSRKPLAGANTLSVQARQLATNQLRNDRDRGHRRFLLPQGHWQQGPCRVWAFCVDPAPGHRGGHPCDVLPSNDICLLPGGRSIHL